MKTCFKCHVLQPLAEFYPHKQMADGHLNKCKACARKDAALYTKARGIDAQWTIAERARHREKSRKYRAEGRSKRPTREENRKRTRGYASRHPEKYRAQQTLGNAIRDKRIFRQPCEVCGCAKVEAHHDDYSKPLDVRWLCTPHHAEHHVKQRDEAILSAA